MKAQTLNINMQVPCDAACPFCISRLTYKTGVTDNTRLIQALPRAIKFATLHQIDTALITGVGEPTSGIQDLCEIMSIIGQSPIPIIELQTNGYKLCKELQALKYLKNLGLNTISISVCSMDPATSSKIMFPKLNDKYDYTDLIKSASDLGLLVRLSLNMLEDDNWDSLPEWAINLKSIGLHQLTLRQIGSPSEMGSNHTGIMNWIGDKAACRNTIQIVKNTVENPERLLRNLTYGARVYDYKGLSTSVVTCMTDNANPDEIRSVILQPDGHCYHSWNFSGSSIW